MRILFVCTGNTCRSSMAEVIAGKWLKDNGPGRTDFELASAGLAAYPGSPASPEAIEVMGMAGIDLTKHRAKRFCGEHADKSDIIITMTNGHKQAILNTFPAAALKVFTLSELADNRSYDISDPIGQPAAVYLKCAREIQELVDKMFHKIVKQTDTR